MRVYYIHGASLLAQTVKNLPTMQETWVQSLGWEDPLEKMEKAMAPHSNTLAWKIPWVEEPGRLQSMDGVTKSRTRLSNFTFTFHFHALEKEMATHSSVLAWRIPGTGQAGGLTSMGSHRVGHNWSNLAAAAAAWRRKWLPTPVFLPGKFHGQRSLAGYIVYGVARSWTWLSD